MQWPFFPRRTRDTREKGCIGCSVDLDEDSSVGPRARLEADRCLVRRSGDALQQPLAEGVLTTVVPLQDVGLVTSLELIEIVTSFVEVEGRADDRSEGPYDLVPLLVLVLELSRSDACVIQDASAELRVVRQGVAVDRHRGRTLLVRLGRGRGRDLRRDLGGRDRRRLLTVVRRDHETDQDRESDDAGDARQPPPQVVVTPLVVVVGGVVGGAGTIAGVSVARHVFYPCILRIFTRQIGLETLFLLCCKDLLP